MTYYPPEQRCPRCLAPLRLGTPTCPNCGLALASRGGAPRVSSSGPLSPWQSADAEVYGAPPTAEPFGSQRSSGPTMYRPGGQPAPGGSGTWDDDAGPSFRRPAPDYQRPRASGDLPGAGSRFAGPGDMFTGNSGPLPGQRQPSASGYPGPLPGQRQRSADWGSTASSQRPFDSQRNTPPGWDSPADYQRPSDYRNTLSGWGSPTGFQRPAVGSRDVSGNYQGTFQSWAPDTPETPADFYEDEAGSEYGRRPAWRGAPGPSWQPGGQSWSQFSAGMPGVYPGSRPAYDDALAPYDAALEQPLRPPPRRGKKVALVLLAILVVLVGGGTAAYLYIHSRPIITVTSKYMIGSTPAGAATTTLHLTGSQFAAHSAVSFLLDGQAEPGAQILQSDANGAIAGDLTITADWALGQRTLTAKDASGNTTLSGKAVIIVAPGAATTPGPNGAPADDTPSFTIVLTGHQHDKDTGQNETFTDRLVVTGQPDPAGGKVCNPETDTGKPQTLKGTTSSVPRVGFTVTVIVQCSGTYKGGKITYMQTWSNFKVVYTNGLSCTAAAPFVNLELDGSFTSATAVSGTISSGTPTFRCNFGRTITSKGVDGTWSGSISS